MDQAPASDLKVRKTVLPDCDESFVARLSVSVKTIKSLLFIFP